MIKGNHRHKGARRRALRVKNEMLRRGGPKQGHGWAAKQAARRANTHRRMGSVAGSIYFR